MAEEKKPAQGWSKSGDNSFIATFSIPRTRQSIDSTPTGLVGAISPIQQVRVIVNNKTGAIDLYKPGSGPFGIGDGKPFSSFSPATGQWSVADPKVFNEIGDAIGPEGILKLRNDAKRGAVTGVINPTSTNEDKSKISSEEGYKSLSNTIKQDPNEEGSEDNSGAQTQEGVSNFNQEGLQNTIGPGKAREDYKNGSGPGGAYIYPISRAPEQDYIKFTMYRFKPKKSSVSNIASGLAFSGGNTDQEKGPLGTALLPIQPQISDSNRVSWGESNLNSIQALAGAAALGAIQGQKDALQTSLEGIQQLVTQNKGDISAGIAAYFAGQAVGANAEFFTRVTGAILNPNLELLFQGPLLRNFSFTFTMSAREREEALEIRKIIRFFKQGMSVQRTRSNLFLQSPNVFDISYVYGRTGSDHPWMNKIKTCALQDCSVNYTPDGNYATYEDGAMTKYDMTLTFGEIDPIYNDDYDKLEKDVIGY